MPRILLIDDDASLLDALSLAFEDAGYEVLTAADGQRGLEVVKKEKPDAVISDVNMPGLDGFSLCRKLREGGNGVPLVLLTSRDDEIDEALGLELGADDYVAKPFSTRVLLARMTALLRREAMRAAHQTERAVAKGALELFPERLEVRYAGKPIAVTGPSSDSSMRSRRGPGSCSRAIGCSRSSAATSRWSPNASSTRTCAACVARSRPWIRCSTASRP